MVGISINFLTYESEKNSWKDVGALAQLGERYTGSVEVSGSSPLCSTIFVYITVTYVLLLMFRVSDKMSNRNQILPNKDIKKIQL